MHEAQEFLQTLTLVLCVAAVTTVVFQRLRQPVILGYLLAGMVVGPHIPVPLIADSHIVNELAELGVILLMFSLGIEFSLRKLARVGATAGFVAVVQCSLMIWLGYLIGQAFGWTWLASLYAGAVIAISSTTIIVKAFEEQRIKGDFTQIVFGVLIVEDMIAILLIVILTALSAGESLGPVELAMQGGRLALFLGALTVIGLLTVPRAMRAIVRLERQETTVVAAVGLAFGFALLATTFGYSVALGAFIAGSLVSESGVERTVEHLVQPVRDVFAAVFFVSVGMLIDPADIAAHGVAVAVFLVAVVVGKVCSVTFSAFLTGQSIQTSLKSGMSLAQIGEFSFIIAGIGVRHACHGQRAVLDRRGGVGAHDVTDPLADPFGRDDRGGCRPQAAASSANVRGPLRIVVRAFARHKRGPRNVACAAAIAVAGGRCRRVHRHRDRGIDRIRRDERPARATDESRAARRHAVDRGRHGGAFRAVFGSA